MLDGKLLSIYTLKIKKYLCGKVWVAIRLNVESIYSIMQNCVCVCVCVDIHLHRTIACTRATTSSALV